MSTSNKPKRRSGRKHKHVHYVHANKNDSDHDHQHQEQNVESTFRSFANEAIEPQPSATKVYLRDLLVLGTFATVTATCMALSVGSAVYGYREFLDKCWDLDASYMIASLLAFSLLIGMITYFFVRMAAQYIVYIGIAIFLSVIMPCSPSRVRNQLKSMFDKQA